MTNDEADALVQAASERLAKRRAREEDDAREREAREEQERALRRSWRHE